VFTANTDSMATVVYSIICIERKGQKEVSGHMWRVVCPKCRSVVFGHNEGVEGCKKRFVQSAMVPYLDRLVGRGGVEFRLSKVPSCRIQTEVGYKG
jgi:hypothetical protein